MSASLKLFSLSIVGTLVGGLIALTEPLKAASAEEACTCTLDEDTPSKYGCDAKDKSICVPGNHACEVKCPE